MNIDAQTKTKLHDMGAGALADAIDAQDETACTGMTFAERLQAAVDEAHSQFVTSKVANLTKRARLRYPEADVRRLEHIEERKLSRTAIAELATCGFAERCDNLVLQGYSGTGKTYLSCALAKEACRRRMRSFYVRVPDVEEPRRAQVDRDGSDAKLVKKLASFQLLVLDEWLLEKPDDGMRTFFLEVMERRFKEGSTVFCTQFQRKDWHARLGGDTTAEAIMDRIVHNSIWMEMGEVNMRERMSKRAG